MMASAKSSKESQNTSLSTWNVSCWTFLSGKSNQPLIAEYASSEREKSESQSRWLGTAFNEAGLGSTYYLGYPRTFLMIQALMV